ncbi:cation:proton antiporter regulatory subunit [Streptomyces sp. NPDC003007]
MPTPPCGRPPAVLRKRGVLRPCPDGLRLTAGADRSDEHSRVRRRLAGQDRAPDLITGVPLARSQVRTRYGITAVGIKRPGEDCTYATAETVVQKGDVLVVIGKTHAVAVFAELS